MERDYEGLMILDPTISEEAVEKEATRISASFPEGKVICQNLGRKKFAYPIKKRTQGYYLLCNFKAEPQKRTEFEKRIKGNPVFLRYLIIKALKLKKKT